jgi:hypothetical protein
MADRRTLTRALEEAGMSWANADRITTEIYDAIHDSVATKQDLRELEQRMIIRVGTLAVVLLTLLFGALHLWPPK